MTLKDFASQLLAERTENSEFSLSEKFSLITMVNALAEAITANNDRQVISVIIEILVHDKACHRLLLETMRDRL